MLKWRKSGCVIYIGPMTWSLNNVMLDAGCARGLPTLRALREEGAEFISDLGRRITASLSFSSSQCRHSARLLRFRRDWKTGSFPQLAKLDDIFYLSMTTWTYRYQILY